MNIDFSLKIRLTLLIGVFLLGVPVSFAKTVPCTKFHSLPSVVTYQNGENIPIVAYDTAAADVLVRQAPNAASKVVDTLKRCEKFSNHSMVMAVNSLGLARVAKLDGGTVHGVSEGDTVSVVQNLGESFVNVCVGNEIIGMQMDDLPDQKQSAGLIHLLKFPVIQWWVKLTTPREKTGYAKGLLDNGKYDEERETFYIGSSEFVDPALKCARKH